MHDTFYFQPKPDGRACCCARTPRRCRSAPWMAQKPPIRIIAPGRVYRCDCDADAHADVPPGRGAGGRRDDATCGQLKWVLEEFCKAFFEVRRCEDALPRLALPVHRAVDGSRHQCDRRRPASRAKARLEDPRLRHGASERAAQRRPRSRRSTRASPSAWASTASPC